MTTATAIIADQIAAAFPFEVDKYPLTGPDNEPTPHYGLRRSDRDGKDAWLALSPKAGYIHHTTEDVVTLCEAAAKGLDVNPDEVEIKAAWFKWGSDEGHRVSIRPTMSYRQSIYGTEDNLFPQIHVSGLYGLSFLGIGGIFRDTCQNMMEVRQVKGTRVKLRHTGQFRENFDKLVEQFATLAAKYDEAVDVARTLEATRVDAVDFMSRMFPAPTEQDSKIVATNHRKRIETIINRVLNERQTTGRPSGDGLKEASLWELVNGVTGYVQHDQTRKINDPTHRAFIGLEEPLTAQAWELAYELAS